MKNGHHPLPRRMALLLLVLALCLPGAALAQEGAAVGFVTGGRLNMREAPSHDSPIVETLVSHTAVTILGAQDGWYEVRAGRDQGFVEAKYIEATSTGRVENGASFVNLRSQPVRGDNVIGRFGTGTLVTLLGDYDDGWCRVSAGGMEGYMASSFIQPVTDGAAPAPAAQPAPEDTATEAEAVQPVSDYMISTDGARDVVHEAGQSESDAGVDGSLLYTVYYPALNLPDADAAIAAWLAETLDDAREMAQQAAAGETVELTVHYDSHLLDSRYIGVLEMGFLDSTLMAHPTDLVLTVNVDAQTGDLLGYADLFTPGRVGDALALLEAKLAAAGILPEGEALDETWLHHALITGEGIVIVLPRAEYLPSYLGTQYVLLPYGELSAAGLLGLAADVAAPAPTPVPAVSAAPTAQAPAARVIDPSRPMVALTFDDGPSDHTLAILALLEQHGGRATFCMVGNRIAQYTDVVAQVAAQGSEIATHTWSHKNLTTISQGEIKSQLTKSINAIERITGQPVTTLRPPYGSVDSNVRAVTRGLGLKIANWSIDTEDWKTNNADATYRAIMNHVKNGSIVLCHDTKGSSAKAMERVIPELVDKGYQLVTVTELLSFSKTHGQAGTLYTHLDTDGLAGQ